MRPNSRQPAAAGYDLLGRWSSGIRKRGPTGSNNAWGEELRKGLGVREGERFQRPAAQPKRGGPNNLRGSDLRRAAAGAVAEKLPTRGCSALCSRVQVWHPLPLLLLPPVPVAPSEAPHKALVVHTLGQRGPLGLGVVLCVVILPILLDKPVGGVGLAGLLENIAGLREGGIGLWGMG